MKCWLLLLLTLISMSHAEEPAVDESIPEEPMGEETVVAPPEEIAPPQVTSEDPCAEWSSSEQTPQTLQALSARGCAPAQASLGLLYYKGSGVEKNTAKAVELYAQAAKSGSVTGQFNLALMYAQGDGVAQNWALAAQWMEAAAKQRHGPAIPLLAAYQRAYSRTQAIDKLLREDLHPLLLAYQNSQDPDSTSIGQAQYNAIRAEIQAQQPKVALGSWPTDGLEEKERLLPSESGKSRAIKEFQVIIPADCATDRFEIGEGHWYQIHIVPITRARLKVQSVQPGGVLEIKGKLTNVELTTWRNKGKDRCGANLPSYTAVNLEVQF